MHDEDVLGKAYDSRLMRRLSVYIRPYGWLVASALGCLMIDGLMQLVGPLMTQRVIDVALPAHDLALVWRSATIFAVSLVIAFACQYGETMLTGLLGQRVMRDLRRDIFAHVQRLPVVFFDRNPVGRLVTRVTSDVESLNELFTSGVVAGLGDLFTLLAISVMMIVTDWRLALASFAVIPFVVLVSHLFRSRCVRRIVTSARGSRGSMPICRSASAGCASCSSSVAKPTSAHASTRSTRRTATRTSPRSRTTRSTSRRSRC
jgi:ATP-binding cassette subfamily B protein